MDIQYFIIAVIVLVVLIFQIRSFKENERRIGKIRNLFPSTNNTEVVVEESTTYLNNSSSSGEFKSTLEDINSYLTHNNNKTYDYQIIKEIVNRNSKSLEDEVDTMITVPLYWGLIATISGIALGIIIFAWKDLPELLSGSSVSSLNPGNMNVAGIRILLTDIGIAMIASLAGVFFTKQSTSHYNEARTLMVQKKNKFLTWIQTDLMSKLSDDITGALIRMTNDLNNFNRSFAVNTYELKQTLLTVKDNYEYQIKLIDTFDKIKINEIANANIKVYDRLQSCTTELERLFEILANSEEYVSKVVELNSNIGSVEERTRLFEELGNYFKDEIEFVRDRQGMMRSHISSLDSVLRDSLSNLGDNVANSIANLNNLFQKQNESIQVLIEEQQREMLNNLQRQQSVVNDKIGQIDNPFDGITEVFADGINGIREAFAAQNVVIKEVLSSQKDALENALINQQKVVLEKLQEAPSQLQAFSDVARELEKLNKTFSRNESDGNLEDNKKTTTNQIIISACSCGSFITLVALLIMKLIGI